MRWGGEEKKELPCESTNKSWDTPRQQPSSRQSALLEEGYHLWKRHREF